MASPQKDVFDSSDSSDNEEQQKRIKSALIDESAEESGADSNSDSDDEEQLQQKNEYVKDDFVVDDAEESDDSDDSDSDDSDAGNKKPRRLKRKKQMDDISEDELDLIRENAEESRKKSRGEDEANDLSDGDNSSMDDFIVDTYEGTAKKKKKNKRRKNTGMDAITDDQAREFNELFAFDPSEFESNLDGDDGAGEAEYVDEDEQQMLKQRKQNQADFHGRYEPDMLKGIYYSDADNKIRSTDIPERFQIKNVQMLGSKRFLKGETLLFVDPTDSYAMDNQAEWVIQRLENVFNEYNDMGIMHDVYNDKKLFSDHFTLLQHVKKALTFFQRDQYEVPYVHTYRAEEVGMLSIYHLWNIYDLGINYQLYLSRIDSLRNYIKANVPNNDSMDQGWLPSQYVGESAVATKNVSSGNPEKPVSSDAPAEQPASSNGPATQTSSSESKEDAPAASSGATDGPVTTTSTTETAMETDGDDKSKGDTTTTSPEDKATKEVSSMSLGNKEDAMDVEKKVEEETNNAPKAVVNSREHLLDLLDELQNEKFADEDTIRELQEFIMFRYKPTNSSSTNTSIKRPGAKSTASVSVNLIPIDSDLCKSIGFATHLGANLDSEYQVYSIPKVDVTPIDESLKWCSEELDNEELVLKAAEDAVARSISLEYRVRTAVRKIYKDIGKITTSPTIKGKKTIVSDDSHEFYPIVSLNRKPYYAFCRPPRREYNEDNMEVDGEDYRDQILHILRAHKEGLLEISVNRDELEEKILSTLVPYFISTEHQTNANETSLHVLPEWEALRVKTLIKAVRGYLIPWAQRQLVEDLKDLAIKFVCSECCYSVRKRIATAPFQLPVNENDSSVPEVPPEKIHVMGVVFSTSKHEQGYAVTLDSNGIVADHRKLPPVQRRREWQPILEAFIEETAPHLICLSSSVGLRIRSVKIHLDRMNSRRMDEYNARKKSNLGYDDEDDMSQYFYTTILDDQVANAFAVSEVGKKEFPEFDVNLRKAISLGRYMQNPLLEVAALFSDTSKSTIRTDDSSILTLVMHRSQRHIPSSQLLSELEKVFINVVAMTGVDINYAIRNEHASHTLQFVSGFGPRKATQLLSVFRRAGGWVYSREQVREKVDGSIQGRNSFKTDSNSQINCSRIYRNSAGFIRCFSRDFDEDDFEENEFAMLDQTRIHPDDFQIAAMLSWMAKYGTESDKQPPEFTYEDGQLNSKYERAVDTVLDSAEKALEERKTSKVSRGTNWFTTWAANRYDDYFKKGSIHLGFLEHKGTDGFNLDDVIQTNISDISSFVSQLEQILGGGSKTAKVLWCIDELRFLRMEIRRPFRELSVQDLFEALTGDNAESLREDMVVTVILRGVDNRFVQADLDGLRCSIHANDLSDERVNIGGERDLQKYIENSLGWKAGNPVQGRIKSINREKFFVNLVTKKSALTQGSRRIRDQYWEDPRLKYGVSAIENEKKKAAQSDKRFKSRPIVHPNFQNIDRRAAEQFLSLGEIGDVVIRPNSNNTSMVTASFKCGKDPLWIQHVAVQEKGKKSSDLKLGKQLLLKNDTFGDLDELIFRYFTPITEFLRDLFASKYYRAGDRRTLENSLRQEKTQNPARIPYCIGRHEREEAAGYFRFFYLPGKNTVHCETLSVTPDGFKLANETHTSVVRLVDWFKKNYKTLGQSSRRGGSSGYGGNYSRGSGNAYNKSSYNNYDRNGGGSRRYDDNYRRDDRSYGYNRGNSGY